MKFFVAVNRKYMVMVDARNNCAAEHIFLDYHGVQYAQAFALDEIYTDTFKGYCQCTETISFKEFQDLVEKYMGNKVKLAQTQKYIETTEKYIEELKGEIEKKKAILKECQEYLKGGMM